MKYTCWEKREFNSEDMNLIEHIQNKFFSISEFNAKLLVSRGIKTDEEIENFMNPNFNQLLDSGLLKDSDIFIKEIIEAKTSHKKVILHSDFDSDGINACVIGIKCLKNIGLDIDYHCNNRFMEGYGLSIESVNNILDKYPDVKLIITADNGISSFSAIDYCNSRGIKVIVTDHHDPSEELPNACCIINPKRKDCPYPFKGLCGAGVIFKLMLLLYDTLKLNKQFVLDLVDLVCIATIGDVVPLVSENRVFVYKGLELMNSDKARLSISCIKKDLNKNNIINEDFIGFTLVPLLNSTSRVTGCCYDAIDFFLQDNIYFIKKHLNSLVSLNNQRKELTSKQNELAYNMINEKSIEDDNCIILYNEHFNEGIIGLTASMLVDKFNVPTIILTKSQNGKVLKGSARSIPGVNIRKYLSKISSNLLKFGGHSGAAGLSLELSYLDKFKDSFVKLMKSVKKNLYETIYIDYIPEELTIDIVKDFSALAPFGEGFSKPQIGLKDYKCFSMEILKDKHLKIRSENNISILKFNCELDIINDLYNAATVKAIGFPSINVYNNKESISFIVSNNNIIKGSEHDYSNFTVCNN